MEEVPQPHTEPENLPPPEPLAKSLDNQHSPRKKQLNFRKFNHQLSTIISISLKLIGIVAVVLLLLAVVRELRFRGYQLQEVHVPKEFEEAGITGNAIAAEIKADIQSIKSRVEQNIKNGILGQWNYMDEQTVKDILIENSSNEVEVDLVGVGVSLNSVVNLISNSLGISRTKKIAVYIKMNNGKAKLSVYVQNELPMEFDVNVDSLGLFQATDRIAQNAAESILKISNTELLLYFLLFDHVTTPKEKNEAIELAKFGLQHDTDTSRHKYYYSFWGWATLGRNNAEAYEKYKRASLSDNRFVSAYIGMGWALNWSQQHEKARESARQAIKILQSKNTTIQEDRRNYQLRICYQSMYNSFWWQFTQDTSVSYLKDSAFYFVKKHADLALKTKDENVKKIIYNNVFQFYWYAGYRDSAFVYLQKVSELIPRLGNKNAAIQYNNVGFFLSEHGAYDSAFVYEQKALEADSTYAATYTTLAEIYGYKKDREKFYYYLEKAFEKGMQDTDEPYTQNDLINPVPPYSLYNNEERYKKLWKKYLK